jgi:hypothetical protein
MPARHGDLDGIAPDPAQPVQRRGTSAGRHGVLTGRKYGGHHPELERVPCPGHRVHTPVDPEEHTGLDPPTDGIAAVSDRTQLPHREKAVLATRHPEERSVFHDAHGSRSTARPHTIFQKGVRVTQFWNIVPLRSLGGPTGG